MVLKKDKFSKKSVRNSDEENLKSSSQTSKHSILISRKSLSSFSSTSTSTSSSKTFSYKTSVNQVQKNLFGEVADLENDSNNQDFKHKDKSAPTEDTTDLLLNKNTNKNSSSHAFKDETKTIQKSLIPKAKTGEEFKKSWLYLILGFCMGIVDAIPGISGSTVSLLVKQYEFVMRTFSKILSKFFIVQGFKSVKRGFDSFSITPIKNHFYEFKLYIPMLLGVGIVVGILLSFVTIARLIENYELIMMKLFFMFTLGVSIYYLYLHKQIFKENYKKPTPMVTFSVSLFLILVLLSYYTDNSISTLSLIVFSIAGFISIVAMLLPGLSGSLVLLLLGVYVPLKDALLSLDLQIMFAFIGGAVLGAVSSIKLIAYLSSNYSIHLKFFILSVLIASTINLWLMAF